MASGLLSSNIVIVLLFICFIPMIYHMLEHNHELYSENTLSFFVGDNPMRYFYFAVCFVFVSIFMCVHECMVRGKMDFMLFLILFSSVALIMIPEQEQLYTHVFFSSLTFINILLYMISNLPQKNGFLTTLTAINILLCIYVVLFFQMSSVVTAELIIIGNFLLYYGLLHRNSLL